MRNSTRFCSGISAPDLADKARILRKLLAVQEIRGQARACHCELAAQPGIGLGIELMEVSRSRRKFAEHRALPGLKKVDPQERARHLQADFFGCFDILWKYAGTFELPVKIASGSDPLSLTRVIANPGRHAGCLLNDGDLPIEGEHL